MAEPAADLAVSVEPAAVQPRCTVLGEGLLATAVAAATSGTAPTGVIVVAGDGWDTVGPRTARQLSRERGAPWLPVHTELSHLVIGPAELPGVPGCVDCADLRRQRSGQHGSGRRAVRQRHGDALASRPSSWLTGLAADLAGALVADEVSRLATDPGTARTRLAMLYVDLETLRITTHPLLADPLCGHCGRVPDDAPDLAVISLEPRPKPAPGVYRVRAIGDELDSLEATFVDSQTGLIRTLTTGHAGGLAVAEAPMGLRSGGTEAGWGRTRSYRASRQTALLEALERYGGLQPGGKRTVVHASYADVREQAIDPRTLGLHPQESYRRPNFPYRAFAETAVCGWVWGYSFARREPVLVPEPYGYFRSRHADPPFVFESSNGCALGGCREEAILYGILEVAERDAFLMTWYARLPVPRIDLGSARDRTIPLIAEAMSAQTGHEIMAFDISLEQGVPCVWAMAVDRTGDPGRPKAVCAAGSHLEWERAIENALSELGPILSDQVNRYPGQRDRASRMVDDPALVTTMADHSLLYAHPAAFARLDFLTGTTETRSVAELGQPTGFANADLRDDLGELLRRFLSTGLDVVVVDQTTPEHRAGDLFCVKVIVPGMLPMTFGHDFRRVDGIPRLYRVPRLLGYVDEPLTPADINPDPHPFP
jgi:ribosomal protein S12 methylthiotransferase accessory factor